MGIVPSMVDILELLAQANPELFADPTKKRAAKPVRPLPDYVDSFDAYLHKQMRICYMQGIDHAAILMACALIEFTLKSVIHFYKLLDSDKNFNPKVWKKLDKQTLGKLIPQARKLKILTKKQENILTKFNINVRTKWMHGATPPQARIVMPKVMDMNYVTGEVNLGPVNPDENIVIQRLIRCFIDRLWAERIVLTIDREVRAIHKKADKVHAKWKKKNKSSPPTQEQLDRVYHNAIKKYGPNAKEYFGLTIGPQS